MISILQPHPAFRALSPAHALLRHGTEGLFSSQAGTAGTRGALKSDVSDLADAAVAAERPDSEHILLRAACSRGQGGSVPAWGSTAPMLQCVEGGEGQEKLKEKVKTTAIKSPYHAWTQALINQWESAEKPAAA